MFIAIFVKYDFIEIWAENCKEFQLIVYKTILIQIILSSLLLLCMQAYQSFNLQKNLN